jgi:hypothetical protein
MKKSSDLYIIGIYFAAVVFLLAVVGLTSSCRILKGKESITQDSTQVKTKLEEVKDTTSAGNVKKSESTSIEEQDWFRILQLARDTVTNNIYPTTIIEGGKNRKEETTKSTDSTWLVNLFVGMKKELDSTRVELSMLKKDKSSQTKGLGLFAIILIALGGAVAIQLLTKGLGRISISLKPKSS